MSKIYIWLVALVVVAFTGGYTGYIYCDHSWQKAKLAAQQQMEQERANWRSELDRANARAVKEIAKRKVEYDAKLKKLAGRSDPTCGLDDAGMRELACAVRPSTCDR